MITPSASSSLKNQDHLGKPLAAGGGKAAANISQDQSKVLDFRIDDLTRQRKEMKKEMEHQENKIKLEREESRLEREESRIEREDLKRMRHQLEEQSENVKKDKKEMEDKIIREKATLKTKEKAAEEQIKNERKQVNQNAEKHQSDINPSIKIVPIPIIKNNSDLSNKNNHNNDTVMAGRKDKNEDDEENSDRNERKEESSTSSGTPTRFMGPMKKEFKLLKKQMTRNLQSLENLKQKIKEDPSKLSTGYDDLRQLRTGHLILKLEELEVEYESDEEYEGDLETLNTLMTSNNLTYETVKESLGEEAGSINNSTNLKLIHMEVPFTEIDVEKLSSPTLYAFLSDVWARVEKSPLYKTSMRDNLASKMIQALMRGKSKRGDSAQIGWC